MFSSGGKESFLRCTLLLTVWVSHLEKDRRRSSCYCQQYLSTDGPRSCLNENYSKFLSPPNMDEQAGLWHQRRVQGGPELRTGLTLPPSRSGEVTTARPTTKGVTNSRPASE